MFDSYMVSYNPSLAYIIHGDTHREPDVALMRCRTVQRRELTFVVIGECELLLSLYRWRFDHPEMIRSHYPFRFGGEDDMAEGRTSTGPCGA